MRYVKKPVNIDAWPISTLCALARIDPDRLPLAVHEAWAKQELQILDTVIVVHTLEGRMRGEHDDWLLRGVRGEFYPCKDGIFHDTYELVSE